ncbi:MAG: ATP synthase subunit I [Terracidiphilus sp.]|jgi:Na+/H+-translocating membrane pyrophosphatase
MTEESHPILGLTEESLEALLKRAIRNTLILGVIPALILLIATGWRDAAMLLTGALISAASIFEWLRLVRLINARMRKQKSQRSAILVVASFLLRLTFFAAAIYGSLRCFQGSPIALLCGLSLAVATLMWEGLRMLKE